MKAVDAYVAVSRARNIRKEEQVNYQGLRVKTMVVLTGKMTNGLNIFFSGEQNERNQLNMKEKTPKNKVSNTNTPKN